MGLLDDAIREHLELKRRSGADPADMARLEDEAFGDGGKHPASSQHHAGEALSGEHGAVDEPAAEPEAHAERESVAEPRRPATEAEIADGPERADAPGEGSAPPGDDAEDSQATRQFTALELDDAQRPGSPERAERAPAEDDEVHDELEDTPDFLQETPEHDRLWFEQKPPRDFDF